MFIKSTKDMTKKKVSKKQKGNGVLADVSERFLQCSVKRFCVKNDTGNRTLSLKKCLDCKYSIISERPYATYPTKKVKYHEDKDNYLKELKYRG